MIPKVKKKAKLAILVYWLEQVHIQNVPTKNDNKEKLRTGNKSMSKPYMMTRTLKF